jgi:hypothetical protein
MGRLFGAALVAGLVTPSGLVSVPVAARDAPVPVVRIDEGAERWVLATERGAATFTLAQAGRPGPLLGFVCSPQAPGRAQIIVPELGAARPDLRFRVDLRVGDTQIAALAETADAQRRPDQPAPTLASISVEQLNSLFRARANALSWRVEAFDGVSRPRMVALLPNPMNRQRADFLRHCG